MSEDDLIAVVGMACRAPGAPDVTALWRNLRAGADAVRRFTPDELAAAGLPAADPTYVPAFGYLDGLEDFDAALFGYTDAEAALLDPQHRIFLEAAWWALEDAGLDPARGTAQIGVFAGCGADRYLRHHLLGNPAVAPAGALPDDWDDALAGGTSDYLPTRVAYALGLTGPAVAVQTACSSSLVAVCQAAQSLLDFRCDVAVAGGAAVASTRQRGYRHRPGGTWSADGVCRPYDADATGQVFGNGGGAVVLKRLADAVADGDHVHGVLAGWAVNNDGAARAGFTVPGVAGQAAVVAEALAAADWDADTVGFVEGHGSGTAVGDAIEIEALTRAFRPSTGRTGYCVLGSAKAGLGNLDAAAGVLGLIKAVLAVRDGVIPPTLHFRRPHPDVDLAATPFTVSAAAREWPGPRRAGVSSFGLGGTNAHVLVQSAPSRPDGPAAAGWLLLPLSAGSPAALRELAARLAAWPAPQQPVADLAYTLAVGRRPLPHRAAVLCQDVADATQALAAIADGTPVAPPAAAPAELREQAATWLGGGNVPPGAGRRVPVPGYPFQRRRHWIEPRAGARV
ncbi:beta-ketoacyl synthase N-terminal-like domain-containing protein [Catellatospora sp. NPDC049609]|uniref:beta-ketoacyl synthase N-terminal-like domain-containing protein n=1 Tax=Catellatospora sp. NPDC049609 TaxID=3155505 RepID=UPI0034421ABE